MFFYLSKTLAPLTVPSNLLTFFVLAGVILFFTRFRKIGRWILLVGLAVFLLFGYLPIGRFAYFTLENRFPVWSGSGAPDGIIILGGPINPYLSDVRGQVTLGDGAERLTEIPNLARKFPNARIVFSGGTAFPDGLPEAKFAVPLLESFGIPRERILFEDRSRNTEENAAFTKVLLNPKSGERWLLVTSALHMPRSVGVFRKAGFPVEPYPVDWHNDGRPNWRWWVPPYSPFGGWAVVDEVSKEWVGLLAYWLTGRTSEFFPGPEPASPAAASPADRRP